MEYEEVFDGIFELFYKHDEKEEPKLAHKIVITLVNWLITTPLYLLPNRTKRFHR